MSIHRRANRTPSCPARALAFAALACPTGVHAHSEVAVSSGGGVSCARATWSGVAFCWGDNLFGQLGLGDMVSRGDLPDQMGDYLPPFEPAAMSARLEAVRTSGVHTCALYASGEVWCVGYNSQGQLGLGDTRNRGTRSRELGARLPAVQLGARQAAIAIEASRHHTCALLTSGGLKW